MPRCEWAEVIVERMSFSPLYVGRLGFSELGQVSNTR